MNTSNKKTCGNSRFAKAGVSCFFDSEVVNSSFVHLMKFSAENPRLPPASASVTLVHAKQIINSKIEQNKSLHKIKDKIQVK